MLPSEIKTKIEAATGQAIEDWFADGRQNLALALDVPLLKERAVERVRGSEAYISAVTALATGEEETDALKGIFDLVKTLIPLLVTL